MPIPQSAQEYLDKMAKEIFGITQTEARSKHICIQCRELVANESSPSYIAYTQCPKCFVDAQACAFTEEGVEN